MELRALPQDINRSRVLCSLADINCDMGFPEVKKVLFILSIFLAHFESSNTKRGILSARGKIYYKAIIRMLRQE
jgi:hypothetical protein